MSTGDAQTSLRTLCFCFAVTWSLPSTCHMQSVWKCPALPYLAHVISRIFCHQSKCSAAPLFISSPECAHLSPSTCKLLFMFLHLILCCPSPYCIPHAIIKCRMMMLISYFPCLAARFSPHEDCSICPFAPLFAYLWIWDSLIRKNIRWFASMPFHFDQEGCCPCCIPLS